MCRLLVVYRYTRVHVHMHVYTFNKYIDINIHTYVHISMHYKDIPTSVCHNTSFLHVKLLRNNDALPGKKNTHVGASTFAVININD